jgi:predicted deacylase
MLPSSLLPLLASVAYATKYGNNWVTVRKDPPQVSAAIPIPSNATLLSPAFLNQTEVPAGFASGEQGPTSDKSLIDFIQSVASRNDWIQYQPADFVSEEGRTMPFIHLSTSSNSSNSAASGNSTDSASQKVRVWIQGAVHGNEPGGDQVVLALLGKLDADKQWAQSLLEKIDLLLLPRYNPDGVAYFQREFASNFDPNRDHTRLARQQTRDIKKRFADFAPHVAVDLHEYGATPIDGGKYRAIVDGMFSSAKNLNIDVAIRNMSEEVFAPGIAKKMEAEGYTWTPYATGGAIDEDDQFVYAEAGTEANIGRNSMGLTQAIVFLFEMRGIGIADQHFARRTATGLNMVEGLLQTAAENSQNVIQTVEGGIQSFITSKENITLTDVSVLSQRTWPLIEEATGKVVQVPAGFYSTTPAIANLTRSRPEAYLIPRAWADIVERLRASGVEVETLADGFTGSVEALTVESAESGESANDDSIISTVTTSPASKTVTLPAGSFRVSTRQKNAALAMVVLEPESKNSYVTDRIIALGKGDEYPIYRLV